MDVSGIPTQVKTGFIIHYHKKLFSKDWKKKYLVLNSDSNLEWFEDEECKSLEGVVNLKQIMSFLAIGEATKYVPGKPKLPPYGQDKLLMAVPDKPCRSSKIEWFLFTDADNLGSWLEAIKTTLPQRQPVSSNGELLCTEASVNMLPQPPFSTPPLQPLPPLPPPPPPPGGPYYLPNNFGTNTNRALPSYPPMYQQQVTTISPVGYPRMQQPPSQTVIVREERSSNDGFVSGLLLGDALGFGLGAGWFPGGGYGGGYTGFDDSQNIQINNYYDVDNTNIENTDFTDVDNSFDTNNFDLGNNDGFCDDGFNF